MKQFFYCSSLEFKLCYGFVKLDIIVTNILRIHRVGKKNRISMNLVLEVDVQYRSFESAKIGLKSSEGYRTVRRCKLDVTNDCALGLSTSGTNKLPSILNGIQKFHIVFHCLSNIGYLKPFEYSPYLQSMFECVQYH